MRNKKVKIPIFSGDLLIHETEDWSIINKRYGLDLDIRTYAIVFPHTTKNGYTQYVVAFRERPPNKIIAHESVHLVNVVFKTIGAQLDITNDEAQAYFTEWIFEQIELFFN